MRPLPSNALVSVLQGVEVFDSQPGPRKYIEITELHEETDHWLVKMSSPDGEGMGGVAHAHQWPAVLEHVLKETGQQELDRQSSLDDLLFARAHLSFKGDILVTTSPFLLRGRSSSWIAETNPRSPREAALILGLFLRHRDDYIYAATPMARFAFDGGLFYWVLTRHLLSSLWSYHALCHRVSDEMGSLGSTVLVRAERAIRSRDFIGAQFYVPQNNNTADRMMYYFDYLTLLLSGALDTQAVIAESVYSISSFSNRRDRVRFHQLDFRQALKAAGAQDLWDAVASSKTQSFLRLLATVRNTIHHTRHETIATGTAFRRDDWTYINVKPELLAAAEDFARQSRSRLEELGFVSSFHGMALVEPYTLGCVLIDSTLELLNKIGDATDVARAVTGDLSGVRLGPPPPSDRTWGESIKRRLLLLGGSPLLAEFRG